jgi:hypothetical protein
VTPQLDLFGEQSAVRAARYSALSLGKRTGPRSASSAAGVRDWGRVFMAISSKAGVGYNP